MKISSKHLRRIVYVVSLAFALLAAFMWGKTKPDKSFSSDGWKIVRQHDTAPSTKSSRFREIEFHYRSGPPYRREDLTFLEYYDVDLGVLVSQGKSAHCKGKLIFAQCSRDNSSKATSLACLDAKQGVEEIQVFSKFFPSWLAPESIQAPKLLGWYKNAAIFQGSCRYCFYAFQVRSNFFTTEENSHEHLVSGELYEIMYYDLEEAKKITRKISDYYSDGKRNTEILVEYCHD
jgi:hypothetical protein